MRVVRFCLIGIVIFSQNILASTECFILKENNIFLKQEGTCHERYAPCSTFKIAISLMGYDDGILIDELHPEYPFRKGYADWLAVWNQPHNPSSWLKNSCVWYSRVITHKLGVDKFKTYVTALNYGNQDVSGQPGVEDTLVDSWISNSLKISPEEQIQFIEALLDSTLPVSIDAHRFTRNIMFLENLDNGWKLYGKTGSGTQRNVDGVKDSNRQIGWFVGWVEKDGRRIIFTQFIADDEKSDTYASFRAKASAKQKLATYLD
jgi:beta-lactamase class D